MRAYFTIIVLSLFISRTLNAQKNEAVAAGIAGVAGIFATAAAYDQFIEKLENEATEWILSERPELVRFQLKLLNIRGEKLTDLSNVSSCAFLVRGNDFPDFVMLWIVSPGWWNDYGVVHSKIVVEIFDKTRWRSVIFAAIQSGLDYEITNPDSIPIYQTYATSKQAENFWDDAASKNAVIAKSSFPKMIASPDGTSRVLRAVVSMNTLVSANGYKYSFFNPMISELPLELKLNKLDGDTYVVRDLDNLRIVYNEKSFNIFFKGINSLVKFNRSIFEDITIEILHLPKTN